jgi:hypothetical protein
MDGHTDLTETIRQFDVVTREWITVTVPVYGTPRRRTRRRRTPRRGLPRDMAGLSAGAPLPEWWRDTAYAPGEPLADMRTYLKEPAMRTHRAAAVVPASPEVYAPPLAH